MFKRQISKRKKKKKTALLELKRRFVLASSLLLFFLSLMKLAWGQEAVRAPMSSDIVTIVPGVAYALMLLALLVSKA